MLKYIQKSLLTTVYFGPQGFQLFSLEDEQKATQDKFSLEPGWNEDWFVIGVDTELGDPYLMIQNSDDAHVYTAIFEGESWSLVPVAVSIDAFIKCLMLLKKSTAQIAEVYVPDATTLADEELLKYLEENLIEASQCEEFWEQFFVCYIDWLEE
ncbi:hypothetical protein ACPUVO_13415 [Pseudocolwellia sp. HL-MZ19]|uniref:hypothetical protein n=1 Tax=unclassified Pseudocolwellia TaxID=2848178 RepID=UPI003CEBDDDF